MTGFIFIIYSIHSTMNVSICVKLSLQKRKKSSLINHLASLCKVVQVKAQWGQTVYHSKNQEGPTILKANYDFLNYQKKKT